ncbi:MAG: GWxTD domain-containing protein [Aureispira sp.]|nr:GWxTD domain-containing protein [Aureispira sp.]
MKKNVWIWTVVFMAMLQGCAIQSHYKLYHKELTIYNENFWPNYKIIHEGDQTFVAIDCPSTYYKINFKGYDGYEAKNIIADISDTITTNDVGDVQKILLDTKAPIFALEIYVEDLLFDQYFHDLVMVNKLQDNAQSIYLTETDGTPIARNYLTSSQEFELHHKTDSIDRFFIKYFKEKQSPAPPPYSRNNPLFDPLHNHDQLFTVPSKKGLKLTQEGLYFVQTDSNSNKGVFINCVDESFPKMTRLNDLILSIRYITKNTEYKALTAAENKKKELDAYWLSRNKDKARARELISTYYNRIQNANQFFTTYKEGWKTDRGLIYTIFGEPRTVRKYSNKEVWYYAQSRSSYPVEMVFTRVGEQYILQRSERLRDPWMTEIKYLRLGQLKRY